MLPNNPRDRAKPLLLEKITFFMVLFLPETSGEWLLGF